MCTERAEWYRTICCSSVGFAQRPRIKAWSDFMCLMASSGSALVHILSRLDLYLQLGICHLGSVSLIMSDCVLYMFSVCCAGCSSPHIPHIQVT